MTSKRQRVDSAGGDEVGILISGCCLGHCLGAPFLLAAFPALMDTNTSLVHPFFGAISIFVSLLVLAVGYDSHRNSTVIIVASIGSLLLLAKILIPSECCSLVQGWISGAVDLSEITLRNWMMFFVAPAGAVLMIIAHLKNRSVLKTHRRCARNP